MEGKIVYFDKPGIRNTEEVLSIAKERAKKLGIKTIVVASTTGNTGVRATEVFTGMKVVVVGHAIGKKNRGVQQLTENNRQKIVANGGLVLNITPLFNSIGHSMQNKLSMPLNAVMVPYTLRLFGEGMKVVVEISVMAADAGLVSIDENIIAIAGTAKGADLAVVLKPVYSQDFFDLKVNEILCKPYSGSPSISVSNASNGYRSYAGSSSSSSED